MSNATTWPFPISWRTLSTGNLRVLERHRAGGAPLDPHLALFGADGQTGGVALDDEGRELLAVDLGEDDEEIGESRVRDVLLRSVQDVVASFGIENGGRAGGQGIGARAGLGESVGADDLAG
jgi:hypothetical protein